jgi:hypothetical protein
VSWGQDTGTEVFFFTRIQRNSSTAYELRLCRWQKYPTIFYWMDGINNRCTTSAAYFSGHISFQTMGIKIALRRLQFSACNAKE